MHNSEVLMLNGNSKYYKSENLVFLFDNSEKECRC